MVRTTSASDEVTPPERLATLVKDVVRAIALPLQDGLKKHGIPYRFWTYLRILWEHDGINQRELSVLANVTDASTHTAILAMERQGLVSRRKLPENRKNICIYLTPEGKACRKKLIALAEEVDAFAVREISPRNLQITRDTLLAVLRNLEERNPKGRRYRVEV